MRVDTHSVGVLIVACLATGCMRPPEPLRQGAFAPISVRQAQEQEHTGERIRWGGAIASVATRKTNTCFEVVSRPLNDEARPRQTDRSDGRFLACIDGFYDPEVYAKARDLTVIGKLDGIVDGQVGDYDYRYPQVDAEQVYLWPMRETVYYAPGYYWDPFWWGPYWQPLPHHAHGGGHRDR